MKSEVTSLLRDHCKTRPLELQDITRNILGLREIIFIKYGICLWHKLGQKLVGEILNRPFKSEVRSLLFEIIAKHDVLCHKTLLGIFKDAEKLFLTKYGICLQFKLGHELVGEP